MSEASIGDVTGLCYLSRRGLPCSLHKTLRNTKTALYASGVMGTASGPLMPLGRETKRRELKKAEKRLRSCGR